MHKENIFDLFNEQNKPAPEPVTEPDVVKRYDTVSRDAIVKPETGKSATPANDDTVKKDDPVEDAEKSNESEVNDNVE